MSERGIAPLMAKKRESLYGNGREMPAVAVIPVEQRR